MMFGLNSWASGCIQIKITGVVFGWQTPLLQDF